MDNLTIWVCAAMASDVYKNEGGLSWTRIMPKSADNGGFYGAAYVKNNDVVIAVRGTQEKQDILDDLNMAPNINGERAGTAMKKMIDDYVRGYSFAKGGGDSIGFLANYIFSRKGTHVATSKWGNRVPEMQAKFGRTYAMQVYRYCQAKNLRLRCFVGHSLGGALAQYLSEQTGVGGEIDINTRIPAVAFNSPNMGTIQGMRQSAGTEILIVNARLDPLSYLTREIGNVTHAKSPKHEYSKLEVSAAPPPPRFMPNEQHTTQEFQKFRDWLLGAMLHYHSIDTLSSFLADREPGHLPLSYFFPLTHGAQGA